MIRRDRDSLEDERAAARLTTEPVRPPIDEGQLSTAVGVFLVLVLMAILKPWGGGTPQPTGFLAIGPDSPVASAPAPTEDRTAQGLAFPVCLDTGGWRVASLETWRTQDVRVWRAIEPIASATGPLDPAIPSVPIVAIELSALGWCAPAFGDAMPVGPATVVAWSVHGTDASLLRLRQVRPEDGVTPIAALYVPLTDCADQATCAPPLPAPVPRQWTTERVVFRYRDDGTGRIGWFAADVEILAEPAGTLASASPAP